MRKPRVHLYTLCWDEADMLGFFFRHYDSWVDRYVVHDDGSTDGSLDILASHPKVELRRLTRTAADSFVLSQKAMQDEAWKESRGEADWVVVTAIDEHIHVPGRTMADYLSEQMERGVTLIPALGFDLHTAEMPEDRGLLIETVTCGRPRTAFNKLSLFDPVAVRETGFGPGRHAAEPVGDLRLPARDELVLWHYKHLGFERNATREASQGLRLGQVDRAEGYAVHYLWSKDRLRTFWDEMEQEGTDLAAAEVVPERACARPLWWEEAGMARAPDGPPSVPASPSSAPTVSVLVKAYNHAPYVGQTIQSVLDQSFQDFEIVVTDDGSTDETVSVLRSFADRRIRLETFSENRGISAAMNATVARARGRYLAILNSDDYALPGRLGRQVAFLDARPDVSLVFGLPQAIDEEGLPTAPYNDFAWPLILPRFSRRAWLRAFFYGGNCLCSPTAMIRREAYAAAGAYDHRLVNLQDLDMWIRILIAGHDIHLLPDVLTAFRIRADNANASAPTREVHLRTTYEMSKILKHFADIDEALFQEVFSVGGADIDTTEPVALRVAELARRVDRVSHQNLAVELLYERATSLHGLRRLRAWSGVVDALNVRRVQERQDDVACLAGTVADRDRTIGGLRSAASERERNIARLREAAARHEGEFTRLRAERAEPPVTARTSGTDRITGS